MRDGLGFRVLRGAPLSGFIFTSAAIALTTTIWGVPQPRAHDEFTYLLAADTFASGRLTNPPPPLPQCFETFFALVEPTYAGRFHAGQGLALAFGQLLGSPFIGVWLGCALASAAIAWMLDAVVEKREAVIGAILSSTILGLSYWSYSYWGGGLAALGGALLVGGVLHGRKAPQRRHAIAAGIGTSLLLLTRPVEGALLWVAVAIAVLSHLRRDRSPARLLLPYFAIVGAAVAFVLYLNHRVTGHALLPPYVAWELRYLSTPPFVWGSLREPEARPSTKPFVDFLAHNLARYRLATEPTTALSDLGDRFLVHFRHYFAWPMWLTLAFAVRARAHDRVVTFALAAIGLVLVVMLGSLWCYPHYLAPLTCLFVFLQVKGLAALSEMRPPFGRRVATIAVALTVLLAAVETRARCTDLAHAWHMSRASLVERLTATSEDHLVVVRYVEPHSWFQEWVYDRADIDGSKIVFARELDDETTKRLLDHYPKRKAWLLTVKDGGAYELTPLR